MAPARQNCCNARVNQPDKAIQRHHAAPGEVGGGKGPAEDVLSADVESVPAQEPVSRRAEHKMKREARIVVVTDKKPSEDRVGDET